jgi:hypothetical protein
LYAAQFGEMSPKAKPHYLASWQQSGEAREVRQYRYLPNREIVRGWWAAATAKATGHIVAKVRRRKSTA